MPMKTVRANGVRVAASGSSGPTLSYTTGLTLWFKADSLVLNDGDAVTTWADSSGNGYDLSQSVAGEKPTYKTAILNGKPVVRFDGGDVLYRNSTTLPLRAHTFFAVFRENTQVTSAAVFTHMSATQDYDALDAFDYETDNNSYWFAAIGSAPGSPYNAKVAGSGAAPWGVYSHVMATTTGTVYKDGSAGGTDSTFNQLDVNSFGGFVVGGHWIGGGIYATLRLNGDIAEILYYGTNLAAGDRQTVERYLGAKYGITVA